MVNSDSIAATALLKGDSGRPICLDQHLSVLLLLCKQHACSASLRTFNISDLQAPICGSVPDRNSGYCFRECYDLCRECGRAWLFLASLVGACSFERVHMSPGVLSIVTPACVLTSTATCPVHLSVCWCLHRSPRVSASREFFHSWCQPFKTAEER